MTNYRELLKDKWMCNRPWRNYETPVQFMLKSNWEIKIELYATSESDAWEILYITTLGE